LTGAKEISEPEMHDFATTCARIGQPVRRKEDLRLVTGKGSYSQVFGFRCQVIGSPSVLEFIAFPSIIIRLPQ
jgi:hypothetical protein